LICCHAFFLIVIQYSTFFPSSPYPFSFFFFLSIFLLRAIVVDLGALANNGGLDSHKKFAACRAVKLEAWKGGQGAKALGVGVGDYKVDGDGKGQVSLGKCLKMQILRDVELFNGVVV
jgi:hypothetical protein